MRRVVTLHIRSVYMILAGIAILLGFLGVFAVREYQIAGAAQSQTAALVGLRLGRYGFGKYGIVDSVDTNARTISISTVNDMTPDAEVNHLVVHVSDEVPIARQVLVADGGAYDALSAQIPLPLSAIKQGDRVLIYIRASGTEKLEATALFFGNPL